MPLTHGFSRVSRNRRCPICGKPDWCVLAGDPAEPELAFCCRVESEKRSGELGWVHRLGRGRRSARRAIYKSVRVVDHERWLQLLEKDCSRVHRRDLAALSDQLGVSQASLLRLGIGWTGKAWSFPMRDGSEQVIGIRLRGPSGRKWSVKGSSSGLFVPTQIGHPSTLFLAEGPTDTAAALDLGIPAIGRPNCSGGAEFVRGICRRLGVKHLVIVADRDRPGREGAERLARQLRVFVSKLTQIEPPSPFNDLRDWLLGGSRNADVLQLTEDLRGGSVKDWVEAAS